MNVLQADSAQLLAALRGLLAAKGLVTEQAIAERVAITDQASPARGAAMVAKAWTDPAYRALMLRDGTAAAEALGVPMRGLPPLGVLENTALIHNLVVCTLCSCYPRAVLGYPPFWFKSAAYRARAVRDPRGLLAEWGTVIPAEVKLRVVDSTADYRWMVLPMRPAGTDGWSAERLAGLVRERDMIGVNRAGGRVTPFPCCLRNGAAAWLGILAMFPLGALAASHPAVEAAHGMVVSSQLLASEAGVDIMKAGGNAVDAAVAVGYAEAVTNPCCGNIGGGGFMVIHLADSRDIFINFREIAPAAATRDMYLDASGNVVQGVSLYGWKAVGVPGTVMGLDAALSKYGTLPRAQVMAPAIRLAREGFVLTRGDTDILDAGVARFQTSPVEAAIFLRPDGTAMQPGDRLVQTDLAATLERIAKEGPAGFYQGLFPASVEAASRAGGGILTAGDFAAYRITEGAPVRCGYRGYVFVSAPPPSSGGTTMCEILGILAGYDMAKLGFHSAESVHLMTEAMRHAYVDRNTYLGDPAFVTNPTDRLLSAEYEASVRAKIGPRASASKQTEAGLGAPEKTETTHYSVVDQAGNAASVTYTINGFFGAHAMAPGTGVLLNDEMDDFTAKPGVPNLFGLVQGDANSVAPGKRPLSSMAPTLVTKDGRIFLVLGSPGGSRIITITLETALNMIDYGMQPQDAVDAPRLHHQWLPDKIFAEPYALSPDTRKILEGMGYDIAEQTPWGAAEVIAVGPARAAGSGPETSGNDSSRTSGMRPGLLYGANDDRRPAGAAVGY